MRYQQKQLHETAQKKSDMFDETQKMLTSSLGAGKVSSFLVLMVTIMMMAMESVGQKLIFFRF